MFGCFANTGILLRVLSLCSLPLSFSLLPKDLQTSTSMSFIGLTGLDLTPRLGHSCTPSPPRPQADDPHLNFEQNFRNVPSKWYTLFLLAGSRDILLRRTDKMEGPQPDREFQCVHTFHVLSLITSVSFFKWWWMEFLSSTAVFLKEVSNKCQSFNMLVFHQKAIVESLKAHLSVKDSLAFQPLLE